MCQRRQLSSVQLQNFTKFCAFRMYIMLLNFVHKFKCDTDLTLIHVILHLPIAMAIFWPLSESLPLNFSIYPYASYLRRCK